jgi:pimeloyl-ACP methyl ester carboxylesterase
VRFRVWAIDFRGHGHSDPAPDGDYGWDRMAEDVHAVVGALSAHGVHVVGHSMGGGAALLAEARWPGGIRAAYVYEPALLDRPMPPAAVGPMVDLTLRRRSVFPSRLDAAARLRLAPAFARWTDASLAAFVEHGLADQPDGSVALRCAPETEAACYASPIAQVTDVLGVGIPVTVGVGLEPDHLGAGASSRILAAGLSHGRLIEHTGLTHFGPFEQPAAIAAEIR